MKQAAERCVEQAYSLTGLSAEAKKARISYLLNSSDRYTDDENPGVSFWFKALLLLKERCRKFIGDPTTTPYQGQ